MIGIGLLAPVLSAAYPIYRGSRVTVHQAINDYDVVLLHFMNPRPLAHEGWRFSSQIAPIFPTSDLGDSRDLLAASTGFSPRINLGYEHMFGNLGVTPGFAFQLARFGMQYQDGPVLYFGAQPNVQAALHLGRFAPYASLGLGDLEVLHGQRDRYPVPGTGGGVPAL